MTYKQDRYSSSTHETSPSSQAVALRLPPASRVKLVFGGGGVPGIFAFAGAAQAIIDAGLIIEAVGGVSAGSVVAALVARGVKLQGAVEQMGPNIDFSLSPLSLLSSTPYLYDTSAVDDMLQKLLPGSIKLVRCPLHIVAANINTQNQVVFTSTVHDMPLWKAVRASMAIPMVFKPVVHGDYTFVDGGLTSNAPGDDIFGSGPEVISFQGSRPVPTKPISGPIDYIERTINTAISANMTEDATPNTVDVPLYGEMLRSKPTSLYIKQNWANGYTATMRWIWRQRNG